MKEEKTVRVRTWLRPIDLPPGSFLIRDSWKSCHGVMAMVLSTNKEGVTIAMKGQIVFLSYKCLMDDGTEYSTDQGQTFNKCERYEEVPAILMEL